MNKKIELIIKNTEDRIKWEQENIDRYLSEIREQVTSSEAYSIVTFLPGKIEQMKESLEHQKAYKEQLQILKFIQSEK